MVEDINIQKVLNKIPTYNLEAIQRILCDQETFQDKAKAISQNGEAPDKNNLPDKTKHNWRHEPYLHSQKEVMIISSYGDETFSGAEVVPKLKENTASDVTTAEIAKRELDVLQDLYSNSQRHSLAYLCIDFPQAQSGKNYYLDRIKQFLQNTKKSGVLFYTGYSERHTGNWCFKDGVITFDEIFGLYMDVMRGKPLLIVSDCNYSSNWVENATQKLDEIGILSCGHHAREQGILLKVFTSCEKNLETTMCLFADKIAAVTAEEDDGYVYYPQGKYDSYRLGICFDFMLIRCNKKHDEPCEVDRSEYSWADRVFNGSLLYCVRGKDRGKPAWHYVLVDEEKEGAFKDKLKTGSVDVADYGKVLKSGWGEDPPKPIKDTMQKRFNKYFPLDE